MTHTNRPESPAQIAVWYFVGATFAFSLPNLLFPDAALWMRILLFVAGMALMIAGGFRLAHEVGARRGGPGGDVPTPTAPPGPGPSGD
ncbi:hypothetical protein HDC37_001568 [Microbacterium sp. AK009]|uniref:hypothetical protein n=1 Tax=Microbacterium sp. AK009 TaxID=2723068 RepID=UPI0015C6D5CB|nr:hypothetical protein [Microbacterium sp. AK009]NYF16743.1 hypothetical protein [Microbacterium sp. AK009]